MRVIIATMDVGPLCLRRMKRGSSMNQIYREAYNAAKAEIAAAQQTAAPAQSGRETAGFDVKA